MKTWGVKAELHLSWPWHWMGMSGQLQTLAALSPAKKPVVPIE
jgi:hypothetical protein